MTLLTNDLKKQFHLIFNEVIYEKDCSYRFIRWEDHYIIYNDNNKEQKLLIPTALIIKFDKEKTREYILLMLTEEQIE